MPKELTDSVKVSEDNSVAYGFKIPDSESKDKENNSCDNTSEVTEKDNETNKQSIECGNVDIVTTLTVSMLMLKLIMTVQKTTVLKMTVHKLRILTS